ncbi:MAG: hypothetical protein QME63_02040 [Actinomycetota bacterium]|nr:hypothetical protein [Actinomycetota bacterium]
MTDDELREIIESEGLAGMTANVFTRNRIYIGRVARINVKTLMLTEPRIIEIGKAEVSEIDATPSIAETVHEEEMPGAAHRYVAISIEHIEAIRF